jgi:hypothetical protein
VHCLKRACQNQLPGASHFGFFRGRCSEISSAFMTRLHARKPDETWKPKRKRIVRQAVAHLSHSSLAGQPCLRCCFPPSSLRDAFQETHVRLLRTRSSNKPSPLAEGERAMTRLPSADHITLVHASHRFPQWFVYPLAHALHPSGISVKTESQRLRSLFLPSITLLGV